MASSASANSPAQQGKTIDLNSLPIQQLNQVKSQLTQELQHLTSSFQQLKTAQAKFRDCGTSIRDGLMRGRQDKTQILIPLTSSLYVPGHLSTSSTTEEETVLVDIGTGFYVEKAPQDAQAFYKRKVDDLQQNLVDLEKIVQGKQGNLNVIEDVLRRKITAGAGAPSAPA